MVAKFQRMEDSSATNSSAAGLVKRRLKRSGGAWTSVDPLFSMRDASETLSQSSRLSPWPAGERGWSAVQHLPSHFSPTFDHSSIVRARALLPQPPQPPPPVAQSFQPDQTKNRARGEPATNRFIRGPARFLTDAMAATVPNLAALKSVTKWNPKCQRR